MEIDLESVRPLRAKAYGTATPEDDAKLVALEQEVEALRAARTAGIPVLASSEPSEDLEYLYAEAERIGFPVFVKAVAGGGGRGMRRVDTREALPEALGAAMREAGVEF